MPLQQLTLLSHFYNIICYVEKNILVARTLITIS